MENREALLRNLLDRIMPEERICQDEQDLSLRYGLKKDSDFRFRLHLDPAGSLLKPFTDLAVLPDELELWNPACEQVLIIENKMSFLSFPRLPGGLKIWGAGKSVVLLKNCPYLADKNVVYWGDMDPQGFEILSLVRAFLPGCQSLCMNREAYNSALEFAHEASMFHVFEDLNLTEEEYNLYHYLVKNPEQSRVEQERLSMEFVRERFKHI